MKQIIQFDSQLSEKIIQMEKASEKSCKIIHEKYKPHFEPFGQNLILELMRTKKGKRSKDQDIFEDDYESFIEVGIEQDEEYYPNGYIPIWKCKEEWFQKTGYLTDKEENEIYEMVQAMVKDMLEDSRPRGD